LTFILCVIHYVLHAVCECGFSRMNADLLENLRLELRRGGLVLAVLAKLRSEYHGYALAKALKESGLEIDESTLYPLLRRLESHKLLVSHWRVEDKRNKRFYRLSADGRPVLDWLLDEWRSINEAIATLLETPVEVRREKS
jgi:PadR family transcriptional regulator, regulatory protein PadR